MVGNAYPTQQKNNMEPFNPEELLILVVDDAPKNLQVVGAMLDDVGYATTFATSGKQALERVQTAKPDLILLDLMMPEMDGLEVCKQLKANLEHRDIPVIFLTASHEEEHLLQAFELGVVDYVTKPFKALELMARVKTHLELKSTRDKLQRTMTELVVTRDAAMEAARAKAQFLATMSHEIRTPMNGVLGMTELLLKTDLNHQQIDFVQTLKASGEGLLMIINDILDFSKLEAGEMRLESVEFEVKSIVDNVIKLFAPQGAAKGVELSYIIAPDVPEKLLGDGYRLRQIISNMIGNAIKFTDRGEVVIEVEMYQDLARTNRDKDKISLSFSVRDTGIGIAPESQEKLFQSFSQVDTSMTRKYGGTGLGLAICKQLVQLMGGSLGCSSTLGVGSTFWFTANFKKYESLEATAKSKVEVVESQLTPSRAEEKVKKQKKKVLLVEDTKINQKVVLNQLQILEYQADVVNNGQEALEKLTAIHDYGIVLMDCQMPVLDGYEATRLLRQEEREESQTVVVGLTANAMEGDREKCLAAGMDDYLSKPVSLEQLSAILEKWSSSVMDSEAKHGAVPPKAPEIVIASDEAIIDFDRLEEITGGDYSLALELLQEFVEELEVCLTEAKQALGNSEAIALAKKAHKIKGSALNMGVDLMPTIAQELQERAKANNLQGAAELLTKLEQILKQVENFLASRA